MCFSKNIFFSFIRIQDVNEAEANFTVARSHSQKFAFVHIAHAQFEHSQGREKSFLMVFVRYSYDMLAGVFQCLLCCLTRQHKESHLHITECDRTGCQTTRTAGDDFAEHAGRENTTVLCRG